MSSIALTQSANPATAMFDDPAARKIYLARAGSDLVVLNTIDQALAGTVPGVRDPVGIAADSGYVYVTSGTNRELTVVAKATWRIADEVKTEGTDPGAVWVDAGRQRLYVLDAGRHDLAVYSTGASPALRTTFRLPVSGATPSIGGALAAGGKLLYVADGPSVLAVDPTTGRVAQQARLQPATTVTGLVYDARTNDLWATTGDHRLMALDGGTLRTTTTLAAPESDRIAFDPDLRFVYTFGKTGFWAYDTNTRSPWSRVEVGGSGGVLGSVDSSSHDLYVYESDLHTVAIYAWPGGGNDLSSAAGDNGAGSTPVATSGGGGGTAPVTPASPTASSLSAGVAAAASPSPTSRSISPPSLATSVPSGSSSTAPTVALPVASPVPVRTSATNSGPPQAP